MRKNGTLVMIILVLSLFMSPTVLAPDTGPVSFTVLKPFPEVMYAGSSYEAEYWLMNVADSDLPVMFNLTVEGPDLEGGEFTVTMVLGVETLDVYEALPGEFRSNTIMFLEPGSISLIVVVSLAPNLKPAGYTMIMELCTLTSITSVVGGETVQVGEEGDFTVEFTPEEDAQIAFIDLVVNPHPEVEPPAGMRALGRYVDISTDAEAFTATIKVYYTDAEMEAAGIKEDTLRLYYFDGTDWVQYEETGVNTDENYVWATVTHFTAFAPFGALSKPPVADADGPYSGRRGRAIEFDGTYSYDPDGTIENYAWDFGDGGTGTGPEPSHTYYSTGTYTVTLTVTDNDELTDSDTTTATISKPPSPAPPVNKDPHAKAGPNQKAWVGEIVYFDGSKSKDTDGTIESYEWDFGDDTATASGEVVEHAYSLPGVYEVTLTVMDNRMAEDSDTCEVKISEPPAPVSNKFAERVREGAGHVVDAMDEANTTVTLDTTDDVTVTVLRYEDNPHPEDPIPAMALPIYVDVEVSDPDAVVWPIYVEISYTDEEIGDLDENTFGIYYWTDDVWQRCSNTGVDTVLNIVWAYMTAEEASGSPILIAGMHAIPTPPLPPILDNLNITPAQLEIGDNVTISFDIMNIDSQSITYAVDIHIENVNDPPPTWPPMDVYLRIWVELEAYESKTVSHTMTMDAIGDFNVTIHGMTGSFTVESPEPEPEPPKPAEFEFSNLVIVPGRRYVTISVDTANVGEEIGSYTVELKLDGEVIKTEEVTLAGGESIRAYFDLTMGEGTYEVEVEGLTGNFTIVLPEPEFEVSDLTITPDEVELGDEVTVSFVITNTDSRSCVFVPFVQIGDTMIMEDVELEGHESRTVSHTITPENVGDYDVAIDGLEDSFTVSKKPIRPIWMQPVYVVGMLIIVASVGVVIYYAWKAKLFSPISSDST